MCVCEQYMWPVRKAIFFCSCAQSFFSPFHAHVHLFALARCNYTSSTMLLLFGCISFHRFRLLHSFYAVEASVLLLFCFAFFLFVHHLSSSVSLSVAIFSLLYWNWPDCLGPNTYCCAILFALSLSIARSLSVFLSFSPFLCHSIELCCHALNHPLLPLPSSAAVSAFLWYECALLIHAALTIISNGL